jgi:hypothetical protein
MNSYPKSGCRLEYNDEIYVRGTWPKSVTWIRLPQDRDQNQVIVKKIIEPSGSMKCGELLTGLSTCRLLQRQSAPLN